MQKVLLQTLQCGLESPRSNGMIPRLDVVDVPFLGIAL